MSKGKIVMKTKSLYLRNNQDKKNKREQRQIHSLRCVIRAKVSLFY